ncbi:DUF445 domain-containing protein [Gimibacter soli]|uniref:DUF445 domain-containing protein n=1 Tax=Gimibacter soli TaxID=3024400 RepID=A0AAF0BN82_9PROT|nr:DUF445 domain-containing protein [Gimibacter soli]WCL55591.1 DUF445 domain-containing protein [Gimibacter soli]
MTTALSADATDLQRQPLSRYRMVATLMLLVMALVFGLTHLADAPGFWISFLQAGTEAAMVGGLADWFAVTALFRHPLGLPIPHTAVLPRNKARLAEGIGNFVERHFLDPGLLTAKFRSINVAMRVSNALSRPDVADKVAAGIIDAVPHILNSVSDAEIRQFMARALEGELKTIDLAGLTGNVLALLKDSDRHHELLDHGLIAARRYLDENRGAIFLAVEERSQWWMPASVDKRIAEGLITGISDLLGDLSHHDHQVRRDFDAAVSDFIEKLKHDPETRRTVEEMREKLFGSEPVQRYLATLWDQVRTKLSEATSARSAPLQAALSAAVQSLGRALGEDAAIQKRFNKAVLVVLRSYIVPWRHEIGAFIREVVDSWEASTLTERLELEVGRDLQFIRMNGTIVGGIVGCILFLLTELPRL